ATALVGALVLGGAAVAVTPWLVRNKVSVGRWALTTDGRATGKANNARTYALLKSGQWFDAVGPDAPPPHEPGPRPPRAATAASTRSGCSCSPTRPPPRWPS